MITYTTYQQIKEEHDLDENRNKTYDVFTNYVMDIISLKKRREIRKNWNNLTKAVQWENYLLQQVNNIKNQKL